MMLNVPGLSNKSTKLSSLSITQIEDPNKQNYFFRYGVTYMKFKKIPTGKENIWELDAYGFCQWDGV